MKFLYLYRYEPCYAFDGYFHADMVRHFNKAGHESFVYGPEMHTKYADITIKNYKDSITLEELHEIFPFDVIICGTQSRMYFNYRPPLVPPIGKTIREGYWVPKDFNSWKGPKIVLDEDTHYENNNDWYRETGINIVFDRHKKNSVDFHIKGSQGLKGFWLPMSVDEELFKPDHRTRIPKLCIAASTAHEIYVYRKMLIKRLVPLGLLVNFEQQKKVGVNYVDCLKTYISHCSCSSIYNITPAKMFEIMSSESVLFTDDNDNYGLEELFAKDSYLTYKKDSSDMAWMAKKIIKETAWTKEIAVRGRQCVLNRHTHAIRIKELVNILEAEL